MDSVVSDDVVLVAFVEKQHDFSVRSQKEVFFWTRVVFNFTSDHVYLFIFYVQFYTCHRARVRLCPPPPVGLDRALVSATRWRDLLRRPLSIHTVHERIQWWMSGNRTLPVLVKIFGFKDLLFLMVVFQILLLWPMGVQPQPDHSQQKRRGRGKKRTLKCLGCWKF